jgi:hypothetical protein
MSKNFSAGDAPVGQVQRHARREHGVAAVGDVGERPTVHESGRALQGLDQIRLERVVQEREHRTGGGELSGGHGVAVAREGHEGAVDARAQVLDPLRQAEHGHHLGGGRDVEARLARKAVSRSPQADHHLAK